MKLLMQYRTLVVSVLLLGALVSGSVYFLFFETQNSNQVEQVEQSLDTAPIETVVGPLLEPAEPVQLRIPRLGIKADFSQPLGLTDTNQSEVPNDYDSVGWYKFGPTPGELGPAVVLGHVDSYTGPAVFFSLGQLQAGDEIFIDRTDGSTATFIVTELERPEQNEFPTKKVYGDIDHAGLRLVTCSGTFVRGKQRYTHNLIVYAKLVGESSALTSTGE